MKNIVADGLPSKFYKADTDGNVYYLSKTNEWVKSTLSPLFDGYVRVRLQRDIPRKLYRVHRIIAETYIPNPNNLPQVNHINGDRRDNRVDNLEWVNNSGNQLASFRTGNRVSTGIPRAVSQHTKDGEFIKEYKSFAEASRVNSLDSVQISRAARGLTPNYAGFIWKCV
ncbi:HNH homing endonuclease [Listeria phage LP-114]|uniref:HNH homing endonuclease n=1 Tax=Listeria phage LP-114 TaxID=1458857 RepID=A0A059T687_9CAUD|nr:HNH homing endonuclease [Listeria phage LP-114]AHL18607.1 HNH homing endonuclease [Listeria phage LP-114]